MGGHHGHDHHRGPAAERRALRGGRRLLWTLLLAGGYMLAEVVGGLWTNSLALLADAGHMLSDVGSLGLSLFALWLAERPPGAQRTYGYYRAEILAALVNGATLVAIAIYIFLEAYRRFRAPPEVAGAGMLAIAAGGLVVNLAGLWILNAGRRESLNIRGAWLHVLTDALGSVGAIVAGLLIWLLGWFWVDPLASVLIAILVIYSSWHLLQEAVSVLMESAPKGLDIDEVRDSIASVPGVIGVHDLHVWTITSGMESLSAHVVAEDARRDPELLGAIRQRLHDRFGIDHVTLQIEPEGFSERQTPF